MLERTVNILNRQGDLLDNFSLYVLLENLKSTVLPSMPSLSPYFVFIGSFHWFGWRSSGSQLRVLSNSRLSL